MLRPAERASTRSRGARKKTPLPMGLVGYVCLKTRNLRHTDRQLDTYATSSFRIETAATAMDGKGTALITGASSGIGAIYAERLAGAGYDLIIVARHADRLRSIAADLTTGSGRSIETIAADLSSSEDVAKIESAFRTDASITMLVNNAGVGATEPLLQADIHAMERLIALNVTAVTRLAYAAACAFAKRGVGTIINLASSVAIHPELLNGVYGASKAFVLAFSRSLHHELTEKGIRVQVVLPGATATDFWRVAGMPLEEMPVGIMMSPENVVDAAIAGFRKGEFVTIPSLPESADWEAFERAREALLPNLNRSTPAARYGVAQHFPPAFN
jgi:short-subunit dehydrogenase